MRYGELPKELGIYKAEPKEMMFYQYLPIKMAGAVEPVYEDRLRCFDEIIGTINCDFIGEYGLDRYVDSYVYLTAKYMFQTPNCSFNREGWHSDGFMTDDVNYIWCDKNPTVFNNGEFSITQDDVISMSDMQQQAKKINDITYRENQILRLNQFNIHRVADIRETGMRAFLKVSFSKDKYDLLGNSHNYLIDYNWDMRCRANHRNIPQSVLTEKEKIKV